MEAIRMPKSTVSRVKVVVVLLGALAVTSCTGVDAQQSVTIGIDDIGGVVTGPSGPEAGVWVIAETTELPTRFNRIVVTDDQGRYVLPDLPDATYDVWVRGYGLVDSDKIRATPGSTLNLMAVVAPDAATAAQYYPAGYWLSLIEVPGRDQFPGTGPEGNGISPSMQSQAQWVRTVKSGGCTACHALGNKATREVPAELGEFDSMVVARVRDPDDLNDLTKNVLSIEGIIRSPTHVVLNTVKEAVGFLPEEITSKD